MKQNISKEEIPSLSEEQRAPVKAALSGASIFLTGSAGTGKTATLLALIKGLRQKYCGRPNAVAVVAPTGVAALQVGGTTIHSWAMLPISADLQHVVSTCNKGEPWRQAQVLVIDEISMVAADLLTVLDELAKKHRRNPKTPFGGLQVIFCGDFLQLPPVQGDRCFKSKAWSEAISQENHYELQYVFRQGSDTDFASVLARIRVGDVDEALLESLRRQESKPPDKDDSSSIIPTKLYTRRDSVQKENEQHLSELLGKAIVFVAKDCGQQELFDPKKLSSWTNAPTTLQLKIGAQVVLLRNMDVYQGLVNGSRGVVVGFCYTGAPVVRFCCCNLDSTVVVTMERMTWTFTRNGKESGSRSQYPLDLAWALTVHKSQGMSLDRVCVDLTGCFQPGMAYVALSRCKTRAGLQVTGLTKNSIKVSPEALAFHNQQQHQDHHRKQHQHKRCKLSNE